MDFEEVKERLQQLIEEKNVSELKKELSNLNEVDVADFLSDLEDDKLIKVFRLLPKDMATDVFVNLDDDRQKDLISSLSKKESIYNLLILKHVSMISVYKYFSSQV